MAIKPWSISTTLRTPDRVIGFLSTIKRLEGRKNDSETQKLFQIYLIKDRHYRPEKNFPESLKEKFNNIEQELTYEEAREIAEAPNYKGGLDLRGRTSMSPLKEFGFIFLDNEIIKISNFGNEILKDNYDIGRVFLNVLLKWQYPHPRNNQYGKEFDVKPLMATMHLINEVNKQVEKPSGISREEFDIFALTLIHHSNIKLRANEIIEFRKKCKKYSGQKLNEFKDKFKKNFLQNFYKDKSITLDSSKFKNLKDYGDNARRYFRLTNLFHFKGNYINLEPRRRREIDLLLRKYDGAADIFEDDEVYIKHITTDSLIFPWETVENLRSIINDIISDITENFDVSQLERKNYKNLNQSDLLNYIEYLRNFRTKQQRTRDHRESQSIESIDNYIGQFENLYKSKKKLSIELERLVTLGLNAINDAIEIKPNYPIGDDGEPTFTAPAGVADIECYYKNFDNICEVTMLKRRDQWFNEGQPVMRHLRDFEEKSPKDNYCVFVAPKIHRDTANTFYISNKHGYEGKKQKIIPLTIKQFVHILKTVRDTKQNGKVFTHQMFRKLLDNIIEYSQEEADSLKWIDNIEIQVNDWSSDILN